jgi:uncharacterized protein (UPF0333 family)
MKKAQISVEYLVIIGFVTFVVIAVLGLAFFYSNSIKDKIRINQINNFANKIISTSETVFYAGSPSQATISVYLPENVQEIIIEDNNLLISVYTSSGTNKISFSSNVPISGNINVFSGLGKIKITAQESSAEITKI